MLAVTISVDNRRLVARLVPAGTRTEAEVLKLGYKFDFRFFQLKLEAFSISLHIFAALARQQLVPGSVRLWGRVEITNHLLAPLYERCSRSNSSL